MFVLSALAECGKITNQVIFANFEKNFNSKKDVTYHIAEFKEIVDDILRTRVAPLVNSR